MIQQRGPDSLSDEPSGSQEKHDVQAGLVRHRSVRRRNLADLESADGRIVDLRDGESGAAGQAGNPLFGLGSLRPRLTTPLSTQTSLGQPENRFVKEPEQRLLVVGSSRTQEKFH